MLMIQIPMDVLRNDHVQWQCINLTVPLPQTQCFVQCLSPSMSDVV